MRNPHPVKWEETQDNLKLNLERNVFGMHAPMRQLMERKIVASVSHSVPDVDSLTMTSYLIRSYYLTQPITFALFYA